MFPASRDVFTGTLARSVQGLWPDEILRPLKWPRRELKGRNFNFTLKLLGGGCRIAVIASS